MPFSLGPDLPYCDRFELGVRTGFDGWFELPLEYADRGSGLLKPADEEVGVAAVAVYGSTWPRRALGLG